MAVFDSRPRGRDRNRSLRPPHIALIVVVIGLLATVWLPFVNGPHLWFGLPSVMLWTIIWVLLLSGALAWLEYGTPHPGDETDELEEVAPR